MASFGCFRAHLETSSNEGNYIRSDRDYLNTRLKNCGHPNYSDGHGGFQERRFGFHNKRFWNQNNRYNWGKFQNGYNRGQWNRNNEGTLTSTLRSNDLRWHLRGRFKGENNCWPQQNRWDGPNNFTRFHNRGYQKHYNRNTPIEENGILRNYKDLDKDNDQYPEYQRYWDTAISEKSFRSEGRTLESRVESITADCKSRNSKIHSTPQSSSQARRDRSRSSSSERTLRHDYHRYLEKRSCENNRARSASNTNEVSTLENRVESRTADCKGRNRKTRYTPQSSSQAPRERSRSCSSERTHRNDYHRYLENRSCENNRERSVSNTNEVSTLEPDDEINLYTSIGRTESPSSKSYNHSPTAVTRPGIYKDINNRSSDSESSSSDDCSSSSSSSSSSSNGSSNNCNDTNKTAASDNNSFKDSTANTIASSAGKINLIPDASRSSQDSGNASMLNVTPLSKDPRGLALDQLRRVTRWVLSSSLQRYMPSIKPPQPSALQEPPSGESTATECEVGVRRDADLNKWSECGVQLVVMVEKEGLYMDAAKNAHKTLWEAGECYSIDWIYRDYTREVWPHKPVDVACSHLGLHYAFSSPAQVELFAHNVSCSLNDGCCLIATALNALRVLEILRKGEDGKYFTCSNYKLKISRSVWSKLPKFGVKLTLQIGTEVFEDSLVQLSVVEDIFKEHRLELLSRRNFMQLFDESCNNSNSLRQLAQLQLVTANCPGRDILSPMLQEIAELFDVIIFRKIAK